MRMVLKTACPDTGSWQNPQAQKAQLGLGGSLMAFILWRPVKGGADQYVTGWAAKGGAASYSNNLKDALRYETLAAAEAARANRTPAGWQVREIAEPG